MFDIYQVEAVTACVKGQADILVAATQELAAALRFINEPSRMQHHWQNIHKLEDAAQFSGAWVEGTGAVGLETSQAGDLWLQNKADHAPDRDANRRDAEPRQG